MIKTIYHLADIHIPEKLERHNEYKEVFENVSKIIKEDKTKKLVVICGDFFDQKNISGTTLTLGIEILTLLSDHCEVILFGGNHDINAKNENNIPYIEAITNNNIVYKNKIHYLKENKIHKIRNINFGLTTITADKVLQIENKNPDELYIGLYHGQIYKSKLDNNYEVKNDGLFRTNDFKDYDITMLGDIHLFQYLNNKKTIAYSSSVIQQNFGEPINNHGMLKWDLKTKKSTFIHIPNKYIFKNHYIEDINNITIDDIENKITRLKLLYKNIKREDIEIYKEKIKKKYNIIKVIQNEICDETNIIIKEGKLINKNIMDIYNDYLAENKLEDDKEINNLICKIIEKTNANEANIIKNLKLKSLEFENLFTYGTKNYINFNSLKGLNILAGANGLGKSSIIDIILFTIYKKFSRGSGKDALNLRHQSGYSKLVVELNGESYEITRKILRVEKSEVMIYKNGINICDKNKLETDKLIVNIFGSYEDMIMSSIILQVGENFIDMDDSKKRTTLYNILGLSNYENIFATINTLYRTFVSNDLEKLKKKLKDFDYNKNITEITEKIQNIQNNIDINENDKNIIIKLCCDIENNINKNIINLDYNELTKNINLLNNKLIKIKKELDNYSYNSNDEIETIKENIIQQNNILNNEIKNIYKNILNVSNIVYEPKKIIQFKKDKKNYSLLIKNLTNENDKIMKNINEFDNFEIIINKLEKQKKYNEKIKTENENINNTIKILEEKNKNLLEHKFNNNCNDCNYNKNIHLKMGYLEDINKLKNKIIIIDEQIDIDIINKINFLKQILENNDKIKKYNDELKLCISNIENEKNKKIDYDNNLNNINKNKIFENEIKNKEEILQNNIIEINKINTYNKIKKDYDEILKNIQNKKNNLEEIDKYKDKIDELEKNNKQKNLLLTKNKELYNNIYENKLLLNNLIQEQKEQEIIKKDIEDKYKEITIYKKTIDFINNGFKKYVFAFKTSMLEKKINNTLRNIANYEVKIDLENKNPEFRKLIQFNDEIKYLNVKELCGFERVAFNVGLRLALNNMSIINKNNFLIIDEGFSASDDVNIHNITYLLELLKKEYEISIIISHLTEIKNLNQNKILITKNEKTGNSKINIK
jgi:DNA repair exonuclease SbcCD ATPase subunit